MKPKIWNDITNILAKLASSSDYDPKVKYDTALEYYGNQIPVLPKPVAGDSGKGVFVKADGTFELKNVSDYVLKPTVNTVSGATPSITPVANNVYECGELTSLTITDPPATGMYVIKFTSGATATVTTIPATIVFPDAFSADANTRYEINVEDGYAVAVGWPVS